MLQKIKIGAKAVARPFVRPIFNRFRHIVREELASASSASGVPKTTDISPFLIDPAFFSELDEAGQKKLFNDNMELFYIETHSFCNRTCWFCPNATLNRRSHSIRMEDRVYDKIISELAEIDYDADLSFSVYNEPLADKNFESDRLIPARRKLQKTRLHLNTNGDYLTSDRLRKLADCGLDRILVSIYVDDNISHEYQYKVALDGLQKKGKELGFEPTLYTEENNLTCVSFDMIGTMNVILHSQNHRIYSQDRGDSLPHELPIPRIYKRTRFCASPYIQMSVQYDGNAMPCVHLRSDYDKHKIFIMGTVTEQTIFEIFAGKVYKDFRVLRTKNINEFPCNSCTTTAETSILNPPNTPILDRPRYRRK